jgi:hypothetical protein
MIDLKVGTRIRFIKTLTEDANEDRPPCVFAHKGDLGTIVEGQYKCKEGQWATVDSWPNPFGVNIDEFEILEN